MMRKLLFVVLPILVIVVAGILFALGNYMGTERSTQTVPARPAQIELAGHQVICPIVMEPALLAELAEPERASVWSIYRHEKVTPAPVMSVSADDTGRFCALTIEQPVSEPGEAVDWRIGQELQFRDGAGPIEIWADVEIQADQKIEANTAVFYLNNSERASGRNFSFFDEESQKFRLVMTRSESGGPVQMWLRLVLNDGVLYPAGGTINVRVHLGKSSG